MAVKYYLSWPLRLLAPPYISLLMWTPPSPHPSPGATLSSHLQQVTLGIQLSCACKQSALADNHGVPAQNILALMSPRSANTLFGNCLSDLNNVLVFNEIPRTPVSSAYKFQLNFKRLQFDTQSFYFLSCNHSNIFSLNICPSLLPHTPHPHPLPLVGLESSPWLCALPIQLLDGKIAGH